MTRLRQQLLKRIGRRYATHTMQICLDQLELSFTRIAQPHLVLDEAAAREVRRLTAGPTATMEQPRMPYWAELWDSARAVGQVLARTSSGGGRVLDLGCGMGLTGAAAAAMGAHVVMADLEPQALLLARLNTLPWQERVRVRRLNWQSDQLGQSFDLILGADILYERDQWAYLDAFWRNHLAVGGNVLLGEPGRQTGDLFSAWARDGSWTVVESAESVTAAPRPVRIFRLSRK